MSRRKTNFYNTIEYIGPRPQKPRRTNVFGGWVILAIAVGVGFWFARPLLPLLNAQGVSLEQADVISRSLDKTDKPAQKLAAAALRHSGEQITYDPSYYRIAYPNGDIPAGKGAATDVVIRCLRQIGIDLQQEVHEDMKDNFRLYPQLWSANEPDANIDHRRVENLQRFFERKHADQTISRDPADYRPGDIVVWSLADAKKHIGIIVPGPGEHMSEPWVVHNIGAGVKWENILFDYKIEGHFRYPVE